MEKKYSESVIAAAKKFGVTPEKIVADITISIENARKNPDPKVQAFWNNAPYKGKEPTTEEMIEYITNSFINKLK